MNASPPPAPYRPRKKSSAWKVILLVIGIPLGLVLGLLSCGMLYEWTASEEPVGEAERAILPTATYFQDWIEGFEPDLSVEVIKKRKYIDDAYEVEYEYEHPDESDPLYVYCAVTIEPDESDASVTYTAMTAGGNIGIALTDASLESRDDLFSWGSKSSCSLMRNGGDPVGNFFVCLSGRKVVMLSFSGVYFDDAEIFGDFMSPLMMRIDAYTP